MRKIYAIFSAALLIFAASCEKEDHAVNQRVTYYPVFEVVGGATYAHQVGTPWVDPGINATLKGEPITVETIGEVDASTSGIYQLVYSYTNVDGFENHATRTVVVYDIANAGAADISGKYSSTTLIDTGRASGPRNWNEFQGSFNYALNIEKGPAKGLFYISDLMVGFYWKFYNGGYGQNYAYRAFVLLNTDNTFSLLNGDDIDPWGDPIYLTAGATSAYNPVSGDVVVSWDYGGSTKYCTTYKR